MAHKAPGKHYREGITLIELTRMFLDDAAAERWFVCQRRSKISPPGRSKTSPLNVMRYAVLGGCPGSP